MNISKRFLRRFSFKNRIKFKSIFLWQSQKQSNRKWSDNKEAFTFTYLGSLGVVLIFQTEGCDVKILSSWNFLEKHSKTPTYTWGESAEEQTWNVWRVRGGKWKTNMWVWKRNNWTTLFTLDLKHVWLCMMFIEGKPLKEMKIIVSQYFTLANILKLNYLSVTHTKSLGFCFNITFQESWAKMIMCLRLWVTQ